ncbi:uncharacterized protein [Cicer arietinum]|uniref:uncharacterized protein n=1 Tax=Cicer arietinum TaxID=3827 RepID=UPI003CC6053A
MDSYYRELLLILYLFAKGKVKEYYTTGEAKQSKKTDPSYDKWKVENNVVMTWLLNSMTNESSENFMYYETAVKIWKQLDIYLDIEWNCTDDDKIYKKLIEKDIIFQFLFGLNKNLDEVRGRILGTKPFPSIREAFAEVTREESRTKIMLGSQSATSTIEGSTLDVRGPPKKGRGRCDHCKRLGHTNETYWVLHGKPRDLKSRFMDAHEYAIN